jgi:hypothetical protein
MADNFIKVFKLVKLKDKIEEKLVEKPLDPKLMENE